MTTTAAEVGGGLALGARRPNTLPSVTGLRFIAAFLVFAGHARGMSIFADQSVQNGYDKVFENSGTLAVACFMTLSGFLLTWSSKPGEPTKAFYRRRFFKVFPNHVVVFAAAVVVLFATGKAVDLWAAVANLFLVNAWIPDFTLGLTFNAVNGPTWSLSVEWALYLLFPLFFVLVKRIRRERLWNWAIGVSALGLTLPIIAHTLLPADPPYPYLEGMSSADMWFLYFGPPTWAIAFVVGMIFARIIQTDQWIRIGILPAALLPVGVFILARFVPPGYGMSVLFPLPVAVLIAAVAAADLGGRTSWLGSKPMVWLGNTSYALFLVHLTLLYTVFEAVGTDLGDGYIVLGWGTLGGVAFLVGILTVGVILSWLLYIGVERPAMRRWSRKREKDQLPTA
jgi:peptidoglycan/LPS O-acetylase OafA/YrhL